MTDITTDELFHSQPTNDFGKKIEAVPNPGVDIGIDINDEFAKEVIEGSKNSILDLQALTSFTTQTQTREQVYQLLDTMAQDPTMSSALELYAEDVTETNDQGKIVWAESSDPNILKYITFLLDALNIDKKIYKWARCLCLYGDLYVKLYRESETKFDISASKKEKAKLNESILKESVNINLFSDKDKYVNYVEMEPDPAQMYELTKFGKTYAYVKAPSATASYPSNSTAMNMGVGSYYKYKFKTEDVTIYNATEYVHACLDDSTSREQEEIDIFLDNKSFNSDNTKYSYTTRRGQSIFYNIFKVWRELMLLQNSILLNRVTKSSVVRIANIEVGDMAKESVSPLLRRIKQMFEQKSSIQAGTSMQEYTNPGPVENTVYVPTRNGQGSISLSQLGGDVNVTGLEDLKYFTNQLFGALRIPAQYLGQTDDNTGFNGGTSLALISSRFAKTIKRLQSTLCTMVTDILNLLLLDRGLDSYVNKFQIRMQAPTTQEEIDRRDNTSSQIQITSDIMNMISDIEDTATRIKILKSMLSNVISNEEVIEILNKEIEKLETSVDGESAGNTPQEPGDDESIDIDLDVDSQPMSKSIPQPTEQDVQSEQPTEEIPGDEEALGELPRPSELGIGDLSTIQ